MIEVLECQECGLFFPSIAAASDHLAQTAGCRRAQGFFTIVLAGRNSVGGVF